MTTISFKIADSEARKLRQQARKRGMTVSELIRHTLFQPGPAQPIALQRCPLTGALIFAPAQEMEPLTSATVKEMLADFP